MSSFNEYFIRSALWPAILFTIIAMIAGGLGNSLIIYIYRHHFHKSVPWLFIYVLSIFDLLACVIAMPSELLILSTFTAYPSSAMCKLSRYLSFTFHGSSCVILMAIALNRYEKVCRPHKQMLNLKRAKRFCAGTIVFACVSYIPCFVIYGEFVFPVVRIGDDVKILPHDFNMTQLVTMNLTSQDVVMGTFCTITKEAKPGVVLGFYFFQLFLYLSLVVLIIFFYSRVICKMISYSKKQEQLLYQMNFQASRTDQIRLDPKTKHPQRNLSIPRDEPTADFSQDFCRNEVTGDMDKTESGEKSSDNAPPPCFPNEEVSSLLPQTNHHHHNNKDNTDTDTATTRENHSNESLGLRIQISPPIIEENENENEIVQRCLTIKQKGGRSENNIHLLSTTAVAVGNRGHRSSDGTNPMESNQLLIRRFKSSDDFKCKISQLQILPPVDPYDAMFEPLFLHAPRTQKKKEKSSVRKSKKERSKSVKRSKSTVDVSLRMVKPNKRDENARSLEGLATLYCKTDNSNNNTINSNNNSININSIHDGTVTLTRRTTPKGSKNCIIPISTTLSMKSAVSYNALDPGRIKDMNRNKGSNDTDINTKSNSINTLDSREKQPNSIDTMDTLDYTVDAMEEGRQEDSNDPLTYDPYDPMTQADDPPPARRDTVSFQKSVTVIHGPNNIVGIQMRRRSESTSNPPSRGSENILTPSPKSKGGVDYRRRQSVRPIRANRTSRILFWISLAFVFSFLPFWIIVFLRTATGPNGLADSTNLELGLMSVFIRFTLVSNAINPLIYGLMNSQFRHRCSDVFRWSKKGPTYN